MSLRNNTIVLTLILGRWSVTYLTVFYSSDDLDITAQRMKAHVHNRCLMGLSPLITIPEYFRRFEGSRPNRRH
ncbi:hypothetical protein DFH08DRAFT_889607 [Mycena albidolilacea]|uniref:Uncharacterized protein n=1 Tax=Mycena albidolilacea TaxID=1033008 RepID=A0AAD6ZGA9_9AGAR|nr:hypothetical protein DFH08DRAFT_889607 [Mycena albidolilacea]